MRHDDADWRAARHEHHRPYPRGVASGLEEIRWWGGLALNAPAVHTPEVCALQSGLRRTRRAATLTFRWNPARPMDATPPCTSALLEAGVARIGNAAAAPSRKWAEVGGAALL